MLKRLNLAGATATNLVPRVSLLFSLREGGKMRNPGNEVDFNVTNKP